MYKTIWTFATARFRITLDVAPEDMDPADSFELEEDIEVARSGDLHDWFQARVMVYLDGREVGSDYLGGCSYASFEDFYQSHRNPDPQDRNCSLMRAARGSNVCICHYFPDMVACAVAEARRALSGVPPIRYGARAAA